MTNEFRRLLNRVSRNIGDKNQGTRTCDAHIRTAAKDDIEGIARCWAEAYPDQGPDLKDLDPSFLAERTLEQFRPRARERVLRGDTFASL